MEGPIGCALCGNPIQPGEARMANHADGVQRFAHAGCVYRDEPTATEHGAWQPAEPVNDGD